MYSLVSDFAKYALLLLIVALFGCQPRQETNPGAACEEDSAIHSLLIDELQQNGYRAGEFPDLIIADSTRLQSIDDSFTDDGNTFRFGISRAIIDRIALKFPEVDTAAISQLWENNHEIISIRDRINLTNSHQEFESGNKSESIDRYLSFSAIGFNTNCTQALVSYLYHCGGTCGFQKYAWFEKKDSTWHQEGEFTELEF